MGLFYSTPKKPVLYSMPEHYYDEWLVIAFNSGYNLPDSHKAVERFHQEYKKDCILSQNRHKIISKDSFPQKSQILGQIQQLFNW